MIIERATSPRTELPCRLWSRFLTLEKTRPHPWDWGFYSFNKLKLQGFSHFVPSYYSSASCVYRSNFIGFGYFLAFDLSITAPYLRVWAVVKSAFPIYGRFRKNVNIIGVKAVLFSVSIYENGVSATCLQSHRFTALIVCLPSPVFCWFWPFRDRDVRITGFLRLICNTVLPASTKYSPFIIRLFPCPHFPC